MIKAVLLDLDDTLIHNPTGAFLTAYFQLVDEHFSRIWGERQYARLLATAVKSIMYGERDNITSNLDVVLATLCREIGHTPVEVLNCLQAFYTNEFHTLRHCVQPVPNAAQLIEDLKQLNYAVVIATNPVYPPQAIQCRLAWGGLPDDLTAYTFVTTGANMHFAKPDPAYYAEILGRIGVEPDEAIMVGDTLENDIDAAAKIGLHTFHVTADNLDDFIAAVPTLETLNAPSHKPEMIAPQLRGNIGALFGLIANVPDHHWHQHPDPEEWSPIQIVCHLLDHESAVHRTRLERILAEDNPFIANPPLPPGPKEAIPCGDGGQEIAMRFLEERRKTLDLVASIQPEDWSRRARHSIFGPTTLLEMAHFTAQHDRLHLNQLCQTLGGCK